jgi:single-stranded-DNA-specific exonuclease
VADVVPLLGENRTLVHFGLRTLGAASRPGMQALMAAARVNVGHVSARDVAYRLAPRLNAAGRMGDARTAVELLITQDPAHALELAQHLEEQNRQRRSEQQSACEEAEEMLWASEQLERRRCIVLSGAGWHQGILGLVASRMTEKFWRPAFVFAANGAGANGATMRGSARSVPGFPLHTVLAECADLLERYGGHAGAAGLSLPADNLPAFTDRINALAERLLGEGPPTPELALDGEVTLAALSPALIDEMDALSPYGQGNPTPAFAASGLQPVGNPTLVGSGGNHLSFMVRQGQTTLRVIAMGRAEWIDEMRARKGETLSLAFEPTLNTYHGRTTVELRVEDMQWDAERMVERRATP